MRPVVCNSTVGIPKGLASNLFPLAVRTKRCAKFIILAAASANVLRFKAITFLPVIGNCRDAVKERQTESGYLTTLFERR